jgi:hypothetical protein
MDEPDIAKRYALSAQRHCWFSTKLESFVTEQAPLVIECLYNVRARAKRPLTPQLPLLPCGILESSALAPYLERWRLDAAVAATRARCTYPALD